MPVDDISPPPDRRSRLALLFQAEDTRLLRYFRKHARHTAEVHDLIQETYVRYLRDPGREINDEAKWLWAIARNVLLEHWSRYNRIKSHRAIMDESHYADWGCPIGLTSPEQMADLESVDRVFNVALERSGLSDREASVYLLRIHRGLSYAAIAELCGLTVEQVKKILRKVRPRFRDCIHRVLGRDVR